MPVLSSIAVFLLWILMILAMTGGVFLRGQGWAVEFSQMDAFGTLLVMLLALMALYQRTFNMARWAPNPFYRTASRWLDEGGSRWLKPAFFFTFGFLLMGHWLRHMTFETNNFDMNCLHQPLFHPFEEVLFYCNACRMNTQFAEHMVWILVPLSLITMVLKSDVFLFVVQSLIVAVPLWLFVTRGPLKDQGRHAFWFFILIALIYPLRNGLMWDFREDAFGLGFFLLAFTAFANSRWIWGTFWILLVLACKENFPAITFLTALVLLVDRNLPLTLRQRWISAITIMVVSAVVFVLYHKVLIPMYMGTSESANNILRLFPGMGSTMSEFIINVLKNPFAFLFKFGDRFFSARSARYIAMLFLPFVVWGWRAWIWVIPGAFTIALNIMSRSDIQNSGSYHYDLIVIPFIAMSVALGIRKASQTRTFEQLKSAWIWALALGLAVAGRGPAFEVTDRLIYLWDRIPAYAKVQSWDVTGPIAANAYILPQFNRIKELRTLGVITQGVPETRRERVETWVRANAPVGLEIQNRAADDAISYALDLRQPWENALAEELKFLGGAVMHLAQDGHGRDYIVLIQMPEPPIRIWCREMNICLESR